MKNPKDLCVTIDDIASRHREWIKIAVYCGCPEHLVDDIVQNMYLKLCEMNINEGGLCRITYKGKLNMVYMFSMINNAITSEHRKRKDVRLVLGHHDKADEYGINEEQYHVMIDHIKDTIDSMHWYDKQLFMLYVNSGHSMRQIEKQTGISLTSINNTIQNVKRKVREENSQEYQDSKKES